MIIEQYDVVGQVLDLPVDVIREAPDNVRSELGDLDELAASIGEVGVLQPITVIADPAGESFMVKTGHRRLAASRAAGLATIPAIVADASDDDARVIAMLIENVQRKDLSPIDEARTYERLIDEFGISQRDLEGRVSRSQSHISKRIALLDLTFEARTLVNSKELTLEQGVNLARLASHPDRMQAALDDIVKHDWEPDRAIDRQLAQAEALDALDAEAEKCAAKKITVLWRQTGMGLTGKEHDARAKALGGAVKVVKSGGYHYDKVLELDKPADHTKEPCHAVVLEYSHGKKVDRIAYCTDVKRHNANGGSKVKAAKKEKPKPNVDPEVEARKARDAEIVVRRTTFVTELVRAGKYDKGLVTTTALSRFVHDDYQFDDLAELLGLDDVRASAEAAVGAYMHKGSDQLLRTVLATLLIGTLSPYARTEDLELLAKFGYTPGDLEQAANDERASDADLNEIENRAFGALDSLIERAQAQSDTVDPEILALGDELEADDTTTERMVEITTLLEAKYTELSPSPPSEQPADSDGITEPVAEAEARDPEPPPGVVDEPLPPCGMAGCLTGHDHMGAHKFAPDPEPDPAPQHKRLDAYSVPRPAGEYERKTRALVADLPADNPDVMVLQQELYRGGISQTRMTEINRALKVLKRVLVKGD